MVRKKIKKIIIFTAFLSLGIYSISLSQIASDSSIVSLCRKAIFIYLDVSGSMYSSTPKYDTLNSTRYNDKNMKLMDAMVFAISDIFSYFDSNTIIRKGDRFELKGFYDSVELLLEPMKSFESEYFSQIQNLHRILDKNLDKRITFSDFEDIFPNTNIKTSKTDFIPIIDDFEKSLFDIKFLNINYKYITFVIFTDGDHEESINKLEAKIKRLRSNHSILFDTKVLRFLFFELYPSNVSKIFNEYLDARIYRLIQIKDISDEVPQIKRIIEFTAQDFIEFRGIEPEKLNIQYKSKNKKKIFTIEGFNESCSEESISKVRLLISKKDDTEGLINKIIKINKNIINPQTAFTINIEIDFKDIQPGEYDLNFIPLTDFRDKDPENLAYSNLSIIKYAINPLTFVLIAILLVIIFIVVLFVKISIRG